jgi:DNA-binding response OmpR family regulator
MKDLGSSLTQSRSERIFVIDDAVDVSNFVARGLTEEGYTVSAAYSGEVGLRRADEGWELIILDLMLPDIPGETVLQYLGQKAERPPVLVLTARGQLEDKLSLFRLGCDDYLTKPFAFEELLERTKALLRRSSKVSTEGLCYEDLALEEETHHLVIGEANAHKRVVLTPKEFAICRLLLSQAGKVVSRKQLLNSVWGFRHEPKTNFIEVHLANLRKKLVPFHRENWIRTVRTSGFMLSRPELNES